MLHYGAAAPIQGKDRMEKLTKAAFAGMLLGACLLAHATDSVQLPNKIPYAQDNDIAGKIKRECPINEQLSEFIVSYAKARNIAMKTVDATDPTMRGRVLVLEITDSVSSGNAFIGHRKATAVSGALYQDGEKIGSFRGERDSMGGAFGGFKGSCSVLGRTVKALGSDIATWLAAPSEDAQLGDL